MIIWYVFVCKILVLRNVKIVKRPVHSSVWCNFFVTRFSKKISWIFKEPCLCWFSSKRKYRLISPLAIHIYLFFINFVFACFAFLILLKNGQVYWKNLEDNKISVNFSQLRAGRWGNLWSWHLRPDKWPRLWAQVCLQQVHTFRY